MFALYGIIREQFSGAYEAWQAGVHPEDRQRGDEESQMGLSGEMEFDNRVPRPLAGWQHQKYPGPWSRATRCRWYTVADHRHKLGHHRPEEFGGGNQLGEQETQPPFQHHVSRHRGFLFNDPCSTPVRISPVCCARDETQSCVLHRLCLQETPLNSSGQITVQVYAGG